MNLYMDEAGYTGEDLINPEQPIFALGSMILDDSECEALHRSIFKGNKSQELKHTALVRKPSGQERILEFLRALHGRRDRVGVYVVHKEFSLITMMVDWWVEPSMKQHGYDLYHRGGHIALSNLSYVTLMNIASQPFLRHFLQRFQAMMRERTPEQYEKFWTFVLNYQRTAHPIVKEVLDHFVVAGMDLGVSHLRSLPVRAMDIAMTVAAATLKIWRDRSAGPFEIIHDRSSAMAKEKWLWDQLVNPYQEPGIIGSGDHKWTLPLNVTGTTFANSMNSLQLQFSDLLAGSMARFMGTRVDKLRRSEYTDSLEEANIHDFLLGGIWPSGEVDPAKLGTESMSGEAVEAISRRITIPTDQQWR